MSIMLKVHIAHARDGSIWPPPGPPSRTGDPGTGFLGLGMNWSRGGIGLAGCRAGKTAHSKTT